MPDLQGDLREAPAGRVARRIMIEVVSPTYEFMVNELCDDPGGDAANVLAQIQVEYGSMYAFLTDADLLGELTLTFSLIEETHPGEVDGQQALTGPPPRVKVERSEARWGELYSVVASGAAISDLGR